MRMLVADDEYPIYAMVTAVMADHGHDVGGSTDPTEVLQMAEQWRVAGRGVDLLITDAQMPAMTGRELAERITAIFPGVRILVMSGDTGDDDALRQRIADGTYSFLSKPFMLHDFITKVAEILDRP